jgi:hypothetical protein
VTVIRAESLLRDEGFAARGLAVSARDDGVNREPPSVPPVGGKKVSGADFDAEGFEFVCEGGFGRVHAAIVSGNVPVWKIGRDCS